MAVRRAVASGNWSDPATWDGGTTIPGNGDTVYANGYTVTIDQHIEIGNTNNFVVGVGSFIPGQYYQITEIGTTNFTPIGATSNSVGTRFRATGSGSGSGKAITLGTITNENFGSAVSGGAFTVLSGTYNIWADTRPQNSSLLTCGGTSNVSVIGNAVGAQGVASTIIFTGSGSHSLVGSVLTNPYALNTSGSVIHVSGTCNFTMVGNVTSWQSNTYCLAISTSGNVNFTGNSSGGYGSVALGISCGHTAGAKVFSGNFYGGSGGAADGLRNVSTGEVVIYGNAYGSNTSTFTVDMNNSVSAGVKNNSSGTITFMGSVYAGSQAPGYLSIAHIGAQNIINGSMYSHQNGVPAVIALKYRTGTALSNSVIRLPVDGVSTFATTYTSDFSGFDLPAAANVRYGVPYALESQVGTCHVPAAASVAAGVPVDNTVGTAVLTPAAVQAIVGAIVADAIDS